MRINKAIGLNENVHTLEGELLRLNIALQKSKELIEEVSDIYCLEPNGVLCYKLDPEGGEEMCVACKAKDFLNIALDK